MSAPSHHVTRYLPQAESNMKRVSLELGGKSALIVLEDAGAEIRALTPLTPNTVELIPALGAFPPPERARPGPGSHTSYKYAPIGADVVYVRIDTVYAVCYSRYILHMYVIVYIYYIYKQHGARAPRAWGGAGSSRNTYSLCT